MLKAIIPAAGLGTRLLTATKEQPKEMLPLFALNKSSMCLKPTIQIIFESLYKQGIREFCFIVGRGKRIIEDHFTPDYIFLDQLNSSGKIDLADGLKMFYKMIEDSNIVWVNQLEPKGFGDAVLQGEFFVDDRFLVHAGDSLIISNDDYIKRLIDVSKDSNAVFFVKRVEDPSQYGVVILDGKRVKKVIEKPKEFISDIAVMPIYIFNIDIFDKLKSVKPYNGEIQLTDAIQTLIDDNKIVYAEFLKDDEVCLDIGNPKIYMEALDVSYKFCMEMIKNGRLFV